MKELCLPLVLATLILLVAKDAAFQDINDIKEESEEFSRHCENTVSSFECESHSGYTLEVDMNSLKDRSTTSLR